MWVPEKLLGCGRLGGRLAQLLWGFLRKLPPRRSDDDRVLVVGGDDLRLSQEPQQRIMRELVDTKLFRFIWFEAVDKAMPGVLPMPMGLTADYVWRAGEKRIIEAIKNVMFQIQLYSVQSGSNEVIFFGCQGP